MHHAFYYPDEDRYVHLSDEDYEAICKLSRLIRKKLRRTQKVHLIHEILGEDVSAHFAIERGQTLEQIQSRLADMNDRGFGKFMYMSDDTYQKIKPEIGKAHLH